MKPNGGECHLLVTTEKSVSINTEGSNVKNKKEQKTTRYKVWFISSLEGHIVSLCKKTSQKIQALSRIANYKDLNKRKVFIKGFVTCQFSYWPLIWMLHSTENNHIINIHKRGLRLTYKDKIII